MKRAQPAVTNSEKQKAYHTPSAPANRLKQKAAGIITKAYRSSEITSAGVPFPSPSNAPELVTETAETINRGLRSFHIPAGCY